MRRRHYEATRTAASAGAINSALNLFEAQAQFEGPERAVHVRFAEHAGGIYLDLADQCWRAVEIGPDGWRVVGSPPLRFRRAAGMLPRWLGCWQPCRPVVPIPCSRYRASRGQPRPSF